MKSYIEEMLENVTGFKAYEMEAPEDAAYPYIVFEARRLSVVDYIENFVLEINVWDKNKTYNRVNGITDKIEKALDHERNLNDKKLGIFYKGNRQAVLDEDKQIKRVREQFDMIVIERR